MGTVVSIYDGNIERTGDNVLLSDNAEIDAAFVARDALNGLGPDAKLRVLIWVAESHELILRDE